jgi:hypothetical protein
MELMCRYQNAVSNLMRGQIRNSKPIITGSYILGLWSPIHMVKVPILSDIPSSERLKFLWATILDWKITTRSINLRQWIQVCFPLYFSQWFDMEDLGYFRFFKFLFLTSGIRAVSMLSHWEFVVFLLSCKISKFVLIFAWDAKRIE